MAELDAGKDSLYFIGEKIGEQDFRMIMTCRDNGHPVFCRFEQMVIACLACDKHIRAGACRGFPTPKQSPGLFWRPSCAYQKKSFRSVRGATKDPVFGICRL